MKRVIVSRHPAAIQFIREEAPEFAEAPVLASATEADVRGRVVAGNLPLHLAAEAAVVVAVEFEGAPPRGAEYSLDDMRAAGARLARYVVRRHDEAITAMQAAVDGLLSYEAADRFVPGTVPGREGGGP